MRLAGHRAEQLQTVGTPDPAVAVGGDLVEQAEGVAVGAVGGPRHQVERGLGGLDALVARVTRSSTVTRLGMPGLRRT